MSKISVVIPTFNEDPKNLSQICSVLKKISQVGQIIVVDDGSKQGLGNGYKKISGIKLISHKKNKGKTEACYTGYKKAKGDYVFFLDADIKGLKPKLLKEVFQLLGEYKIVKLVKGAADPSRKMVRSIYIIGGEIIIEKSLLDRNEKQIFSGEPWQLELRLIDLILENKKSFAFAYLKGVEHTYKIQKLPLNEAITRLLDSTNQVFFKNNGLWRYFKAVYYLREEIRNKKVIAAN